MTADTSASETRSLAANPVPWRRPDWRRSLQLALAAIWLLDGVLQLQPFMFTPGSKGFSGMLTGTASGNPGGIATSITWAAKIIDHHPVGTNTVFALIQILLGLGIAWKSLLKPALAVSVVWSLAVWWFGEGLGGVLHGQGTPIGGGPGAVLFYALLAILLWPAESAGTARFAAAGSIGESAGHAVWAVTWALLAYLSLHGPARAPGAVHDVVAGNNSGQPGWLATLDRNAAAAVNHDGLVLAIVLAVLCAVIALSVYLPVPAARAGVVLAVIVALAIWVVTENFGMILAGGATDPNSGPLLVLLSLAYWPLAAVPGAARYPTTAVAVPVEVS